MIDSDKRSCDADINETKQRIETEFNRREMFCWITKGKEIENYIPWEAINEVYSNSPQKQCEQYELFPKYIEKACPGFMQNKVKFAKHIVPYITTENAWKIVDLEKNIKDLAVCIKKWNRMS